MLSQSHGQQNVKICSEYFILVIDHVGLYLLCRETHYQEVWLSFFIFHIGLDVKIHGGYFTICSSFNGLLALEANWICRTRRGASSTIVGKLSKLRRSEVFRMRAGKNSFIYYLQSVYSIVTFIAQNTFPSNRGIILEQPYLCYTPYTTQWFLI